MKLRSTFDGLKPLFHSFSSLISLIALCTLCVPVARAGSWYVNDNDPSGDTYTTAFGSSTNSGTSASPFAAISQAVTTASAGDTVYVDAGNYTLTSSVIIDKSLVVLGANATTNPNLSSWLANPSRNTESVVTFNGNVFVVKANDVTVAGFKITGCGQGGSGISGASTGYPFRNCTIRNNIISNNPNSFPVRFSGGVTGTSYAVGLVIRDNRFENNNRGGSGNLLNISTVTLRRCENGTVAGNYIDRSRKFAVELDGIGTWVVADNRISNSDSTAVQIQTTFSATQSVTVSGNILTGYRPCVKALKTSAVTLSLNVLDNAMSIDVSSMNENVGIVDVVNVRNLSANTSNLISGNVLELLRSGTLDTLRFSASGIRLSGDVGKVGISSNDILGNGHNVFSGITGPAMTGIHMVSDIASTVTGLFTGNLTARNNRIHGFRDCVSLFDENTLSAAPIHPGAVVTCTENSLIPGNGGMAFLLANGGASVAGTCNWFGTGAYQSIQQLLTGPVLFTPWLISGSDTSVSIGFQPSASCSGTPVTVSHTAHDALCFGTASGEAMVNPSGGSLPYSYLWSDGNTLQHRTDLLAGTYTVLVTDDNGSTVSDTISIEEPDPLESADTVTACDHYLWWADGITYDRSGTYSAVVPGLNGCDSTLTLILTIDPLPRADAGADGHICFPGAPAQLNGTVSSTNGLGEWLGGSGTFVPDRFSLTATYEPAASEVGGNVTLTLQTAEINSTCPDATDQVVFSVVGTLVDAGPGGSVCISGAYQTDGFIDGLVTTGYWTTNGSGSFSPSAFDLNAEYHPGPADPPTVTLTLHSDPLNGCYSVTDDVLLTIDEESTADAGSDQTVCAGSTISLNGSISGSSTTGTWSTTGSGTFADPTSGVTTYVPSPADISAGGVALTLTPDISNACIPVPSTAHITIIPVSTVLTLDTACFSYFWLADGQTYTASGTYTYVHDCITETLELEIFDPAGYSADVDRTDVTCFGRQDGSISFSNGSGGSGYYEYSVAYQGATWQSSPVFTGLSAGDYVLRIRDARFPGCDKILDTLTITAPNILSVSVTVAPSDTVCQGSFIELCAETSRSTGELSYFWSDESIGPCISIGYPGTWTYDVQVADINGCTAVSAPVSVTVLPNVTSSVSITANPSGPVGSNTVVTFTAVPVNGGIAPTYRWLRNGTIVGSNSPVYTDSLWTDTTAVRCEMTSSIVCALPQPAASNVIYVPAYPADVRYIVSDVTANKVYYYSGAFNLIRSAPLAAPTANGSANAEDICVAGNRIYILDGNSKRVYASNGPGATLSVSRSLRNTSGQGLSQLTGIYVLGKDLMVVDKNAKAIYRYDLADAFTGTSVYPALEKFNLASLNINAEAFTYDLKTSAFYVLDNSIPKTIFKYPAVIASSGITATGPSMKSRPLQSTSGATVVTVTGLVADGPYLRITDRGTDQSLDYEIGNLFTANNTVGLNARTSFALNSGNLNSTGISMVSSVALLRNSENPVAIAQTDNTGSEFQEVRVYPNPASGRVTVDISGWEAGREGRMEIMDMTGRLLHSRQLASEGSRLVIEEDIDELPSGCFQIILKQGSRIDVVRLIVH
ncbi:MAG: hypothetical protein RL213_2215 [Bacteroidota bacterium]